MAHDDLFGWLKGLLAAIVNSPRSALGRRKSNRPPAMSPDHSRERSQVRLRMLAALPYPRIEVTGERAMAEWERLRADGRGWPVIVGDDEQLDAIAEQFSIDDEAVFSPPGRISLPKKALEPAAILAEAAALDLSFDVPLEPDADPDLPDAPLGEWPATDAVTSVGLTVASDIRSGRPLPVVHILLTPAERSWEVPAYLRWGDWNACPSPAQHVAALRHWHERFAVELIGIDGATLNLRAARRPADRTAALALAREQYRYCPDIVEQGVGNLSALAATLMISDWWYFWWD